MAKFQPPPIQGQTFLDPDAEAPSFAWQKWFELVKTQFDAMTDQIAALQAQVKSLGG